jgi:hypothetical protein
MIIVEDRLKELFDTLPPIQIGGESFDAVFKYGDQKELMAFLASTKGDAVKPYPLIWYVQPNAETDNGHDQEVSLTLPLVLAVNNPKEMLNDERKETTYKTILEPLRANVRTALKKASILNLTGADVRFTTTKFPNYSGDDNNTEESELQDVWDAIKQVQDVTINNHCLKTFLY